MPLPDNFSRPAPEDDSPKKYTHRISVPVNLVFDLESDNEVPTHDEVNSFVWDTFAHDDYGVCLDTPIDGYHARLYLGKVDTETGNLTTDFSVEDTTDNQEES